MEALEVIGQRSQGWNSRDGKIRKENTMLYCVCVCVCARAHVRMREKSCLNQGVLTWKIGKIRANFMIFFLDSLSLKDA